MEGKFAIKVTIDRDECISCATCWAECPDFFEENIDDGMSQIVEKYSVGGDIAVGKAPRNLEECVREAADGCPIEIIHIKEGEQG